MDTSVYSNFPAEIDRFPIKTDLMYEQLADARRYQELKIKSYLTEVEQVELNNLVDKLKTSIWFCEDLNAISGGLTKLEEYFRDNTVIQLKDWKNEIQAFANDYQTLTQLFFQSWTTTDSKDYDIHKGNETLNSSVELLVDAPANIEIVIDGQQVGYNNYSIQANTSSKKTIIRFNASYTVPAGKRMEARWNDTSGRVFSVSSHRHQSGDIDGLPTVAKSGKYTDLTGIPTQFVPSAHEHTWGQVTGKPITYPASAHTHDDRYYTESEMNTKLAGKSDATHKHTIADVAGLQGEIDSLKSSVSSGKNVIASAITAKGVAASGSDTHAILANKISSISTGLPLYDSEFVGRYTSKTVLTEGVTYIARNVGSGTFGVCNPKLSATVWSGGSFVFTATAGAYISASETGVLELYKVNMSNKMSYIEKAIYVSDGGSSAKINVLSLNSKGIAFITGVTTPSQYYIEDSYIEVIVDGGVPLTYRYSQMPQVSGAGIVFTKSIRINIFARPCHDDNDGGSMNTVCAVSYATF